MLQKLIQQLQIISQRPLYWLLYIIGCLSMLVVALYSQHVSGEPPCVICIQVRLLISLLLIVSVIGMMTRNNRWLNTTSNLSVLLIALSLTERSYMLLGTERGFVFSDCGFDLGLPAWFDIEQWLPWLYRVETSCGYTPEVIFGFTMAELLMVMSVTLLLVSLTVFLSGLVQNKAARSQHSSSKR
ncbi:MAG: disulfide bond formation protein B [Proteobacteria bacterium]|nr:disulfide bond formation protein B [Pseudomonadota bacterium]